MKTWLVVLALVVGATARQAYACDQGGSKGIPGEVVALGVGYTAATLVFSMGDLADRDHSQGYAIAEVAFNTPAALFAGVVAYEVPNGSSNDTLRYTAVGLAVLHTVLTIHGIYTLHDITTRRDIPFTGPPGSFQVGSVKAAVSPVPIKDGAALGLSGVF